MVSIIMCMFREPIQYIEKSLESVLQQTYKDIEVIIMIDDPANEMLVDYVRKKTTEDCRIRYYVNEENIGLTASLNRAKSYVKGEYVARMDADDICVVDRIESQLSYLREYGLDIVGCNVKDIDEKGNFIIASTSTFPTEDKVIKEYLKTNSAIPHPTWFVRREIYEKYDYVDFPACEDYELLTRLALDDVKMGNLKEPKLYYRINSNGISSSKKVMQKTSFFYVRNNYKKRKVSKLDEFNSFYESPKGIKKRKKLENYYAKSSELKKLKKEKKWLKFFLMGICVFICSYEGRNVVISYLRGRLLISKFEHNC